MKENENKNPNDNIEFILDSFDSDDTSSNEYYIDNQNYYSATTNNLFIGSYEDEDFDMPPSPVKYKSQPYFGLYSFIQKALPKKDDDVKTLSFKIVAYILIVTIIASVVYLISYFANDFHNDAIIDELRNTYNINRDNNDYNENGTLSKFDALLQENPDTIGWITIDNTVIDYPVYQSTENDYYISHNALGEKSSYGALFVDCNNSVKPYNKTQNITIYGHHMKNGSMFGSLTKYKNLDYYRKNPTISFDTIYEKGEYKIFAVIVADEFPDTAYDYEYSFWQSNFTTEDDFMQWVNHGRVRSLINTTVDVDVHDEIITLSTCDRTYYSEARFVILARRVREGESLNVDTTNAIVNPNPLYPQKYYQLKHLTPSSDIPFNSNSSFGNTSGDDIVITTPTSPVIILPSTSNASSDNQVITSNELPPPSSTITSSEVSSAVSSDTSSTITSDVSSTETSQVVSSQISSTETSSSAPENSEVSSTESIPEASSEVSSQDEPSE